MLEKKVSYFLFFLGQRWQYWDRVSKCAYMKMFRSSVDERKIRLANPAVKNVLVSTTLGFLVWFKLLIMIVVNTSSSRNYIIVELAQMTIRLFWGCLWLMSFQRSWKNNFYKYSVIENDESCMIYKYQIVNCMVLIV